MIALIRRQLRTNRTSVIVMSVLMVVVTAVQVQGYQSAFPDPRTRAALLSGLTSNGALRALYGFPYDIGNATGWLSWRGMSTVELIMAVWASFVTVGAMRGEEETGRADLLLVQPVSRRAWFLSVLAAVGIETLVIGATTVAGLLAVGVSQGLMTPIDCAEIALQLVLPALLFSAVGGVAGQLVGTTRGARIAAAGILAIALLVRSAADVGGGITWLRWTTPLGWFEELRPPAAPASGALVATGVTTLLLVVTAMRMLATRDIGLGLLPRNDRREPRRVLLGAPWQAALRDDSPMLGAWIAGAAAFALLLGGLTKSVLEFLSSDSTLSGVVGSNFGLTAYMASALSVVQLVVVLLAVTLVVGIRGDEASGRLELLIAAPLSRVRWLLSRTLLAVSIASIVAAVSALALWGGTSLSGRQAELGPLVAAALNCVPLIALCAGGTAVVFAVAPRAVSFVYAPIGVAYLWEALGTALKAPAWSLDLSPFHVLAAMPREDFAPIPAAILLASGAAMLAAAASVFRARDLAVG